MKLKLELIINNEELRKDLVVKGLARVKLYDWWECARLTKETYEQVLAPQRGDQS
jgi:glycosyltransferase involved in cell wall biosynthesis